MSVTIALAGNPNSGKTTLFNELTGSHQYVGNWPGVTVEHKTGEYKKDTSIKFTDLPGIYSLSPYTLEEVVSRNYLLSGDPDVIIDVVDASNIERNLYLTTQLAEIGLPVVIALNMMDVVEKNKDKIDTEELSKRFNCKIVEVSALKNKNIDKLIEVAVEVAKEKQAYHTISPYSEKIEKHITTIEDTVKSLQGNPAKRFIAVKLFEDDDRVKESLEISKAEQEIINKIIQEAEKKYDDDTEGIITDERYNFVTGVTSEVVQRGRLGATNSEKIDRILTNRFLSLPIFVGIMTLVYWLSITVAGGPLVDGLNRFILDPITNLIAGLLERGNVSPALESLVLDGILGGVFGVIGFLPIIASLFFFITILEDVGYMSRIAFILDKVFRKFGLSGKSFIPILIGTGCSVPGIVGTRTIESDSDRRLTITVSSMMPCGAKTDIIAMFAAIYSGHFWFGPIWYFGGIIAIIISGLILKKTERFNSSPTPFVMELPEYHMPSMKNVFNIVWFRIKSFIIKAGTIILLSSVIVWLLQNITIDASFTPFGETGSESLLSFLGHKIAWIFGPLGFGDWMATVATVLGLLAKEMVVSTFGVLANLGEVEAGSSALTSFIKSYFTTASMLSFMFYNQFTIPCFAAVGAIRQEMGDRRWFAFTIGYIILFSYTMTLMIYQFSRVLIDGQPPTMWTYIGLGILAVYIFLLFRPNKNQSEEVTVKRREKSWEI